MLDFSIIDAHPHGLDDTWRRRFTVADYQAQTAGIAIETMVFVQCFVDTGGFLREVALVEENAVRDPRIRAVVANAPLALGEDARPFLGALLRFHPMVRGIRRMIAFQVDAAIATRPGFRAGVQAMRLVLDHGGKPAVKGGVRDGRFGVWRDAIRAFAQNPDMFCKLSDLPVEGDHAAWTEAELRLYRDAVVGVCGFDRLIFAFDWPVCTQAVRPQRWLEVLDTAFIGVAEVDLRRFYAGNARRVNRMGA